MDPALKEYLDAMRADAAALETRVLSAMDNRFDILQAKQDDLVSQIEYQSSYVFDLAGWRPEMENRFAQLEAAVEDLKRAQPPTAAAAASGSGACHIVSNTSPASSGPIHGQIGHGENVTSGGLPAAALGSPSVPPVKGTFSFQTPIPDTADPQFVTSQIMTGLGANAPSFPFPSFTGDNPNLWITLAEQYFQTLAIHESYWVPMSILHFSGSAGIWLQSVRRKITVLDWISFTSLLSTRFGRDRHQLLIRQFYTIKQTSSVAEYIERFDVLMNHLVSYSDTTHPFYFLTRFIEGLRADIRAVVMVQRPTDLDTACSLALLQEEVAEGELPFPSKQEQRYIAFPRKSIASTSASASPAVAGRAVDSRGIEAARTNNPDKYNALRAYRKAKGLCFKCGERWGHDHTCPQTVQLHVVEELLSLLSQEELRGIDNTESSGEEQEVVCSVSLHALTGSTSDVPGVIQLQAFIEKHEILILVDSGSSTSFINQQLAQELSGIQPLLKPCRVKVADGAQHRCSSYIPQCQWSSQGHQFATDLKLLPLGAFDMILGMD
jgi:hypothetical protein